MKIDAVASGDATLYASDPPPLPLEPGQEIPWREAPPGAVLQNVELGSGVGRYVGQVTAPLLHLGFSGPNHLPGSGPYTIAALRKFVREALVDLKRQRDKSPRPAPGPHHQVQVNMWNTERDGLIAVLEDYLETHREGGRAFQCMWYRGVLGQLLGFPMPGSTRAFITEALNTSPSPLPHPEPGWQILPSYPSAEKAPALQIGEAVYLEDEHTMVGRAADGKLWDLGTGLPWERKFGKPAWPDQGSGFPEIISEKPPGGENITSSPSEEAGPGSDNIPSRAGENIIFGPDPHFGTPCRVDDVAGLVTVQTRGLREQQALKAWLDQQSHRANMSPDRMAGRLALELQEIRQVHEQLLDEHVALRGQHAAMPPFRVYVADQFGNWQRAREVMDGLRAQGIEITHDWTVVAEALKGVSAKGYEPAAEVDPFQEARRDTEGVWGCHLFILLAAEKGGAGRWVEFGMARERVACLVWGKMQDCIFFNHPNVHLVNPEEGNLHDVIRTALEIRARVEADYRHHTEDLTISALKAVRRTNSVSYETVN